LIAGRLWLAETHWQVAMARPGVVPAGAAGPEGTGYRAAPVQTG
jgi:hypothetical protein